MNEELRVRLRSIRGFVSSTSGVLYNNQDIIGEFDGKPFKGLVRSHYDGQGVSLFRAIGIQVAFVTVDPLASSDLICRVIESWNSLPSSTKVDGDGGWPLVKLIGGVIGEEQILPVANWLGSLCIHFADCAVMGHDLVQMPLMRAAAKAGAFLVAPAQAEEVAKKMADCITVRLGGNGALRDFANLVLEAKDIDPTTLPTR